MGWDWLVVPFVGGAGAAEYGGLGGCADHAAKGISLSWHQEWREIVAEMLEGGPKTFEARDIPQQANSSQASCSPSPGL